MLLNAINNVKKLLENFMKKNCRRQFRIEKVTKRKSNKLYIKWKAYDNYLHSWIDKNGNV